MREDDLKNCPGVKPGLIFFPEDKNNKKEY